MRNNKILKSIFLVGMLMGSLAHAQVDDAFDSYVQEKFGDFTIVQLEQEYKTYSQNITLKYSKFTQSIKKLLDLLTEKKEDGLKKFQTSPIKDLLED